MRSSTSLLGRDFWGIASEMLDILTKIFLRVLRVIRGFFLVACGKKSFILTNKKRKIYGKIWSVSVLFVYLQPEK